MVVKPWYKQFWPWFIIAIPASSMFVAVFQVYFALNSPRDLVKDDYYKEGRAINYELSRKSKAAELGITATLIVDALTGDILLSTTNVNSDSLLLSFNHVALASQDFQVELRPIAENEYRGALKNTISGNWNMALSSSENWLITGRLDLNQSNQLLFAP